ncbi:hypothetical protein HUJ05_004329 [Dendroctonus ponderosae]|nr:hypothetical protein HUJ05_004329 [Dendroctonus ponderosae]
MATLGEIDKIAQNIAHSQLKVIKVLYVIAFGVEPPPPKARKELKDFRSVEIVANRICSFLNDPKENVTSSADRDEEEEEENTEDEEYDEDNTKSVTTKLNYFALTFRDIEDSIRSYDGTPGYPIQKWIQDFEEIAEITQWNDLQKLILAKKSLSGLARLFVQSQKGSRSWLVRRVSDFEAMIRVKRIKDFKEKILLNECQAQRKYALIVEAKVISRLTALIRIREPNVSNVRDLDILQKIVMERNQSIEV